MPPIETPTPPSDSLIEFSGDSPSSPLDRFWNIQSQLQANVETYERLLIEYDKISKALQANAIALEGEVS